MRQTPIPISRRPSISGLHNLRDVGGYEVNGGVTRWRTLLRSDALHQLNEEGREALRDLGVRTIIDLRKPSERQAFPKTWTDTGIEFRDIAVYEDVADLGIDPARSFDMAVYYEGMVRHAGRQLAQAVIAIADAPATVLVHCTAGKDRTGLVVALALLVVGVSRRDVVADYSTSELMLAGDWAEQMLERVKRERGLPAVMDPAGIAGSPAAVLSGTLDLIDREHDGVQAYLETHGMTASAADRLRTMLVAPTTVEGAFR